MRVSFICSVALMAAVACGSGDAGTPSRTPTGPTGPSGPVVPQASLVYISEYSFSPQTTTIKVGSTVTWQNNGQVAHTATADGGLFNSGQLGAGMAGAYGSTEGASFNYTFTATGTFAFHCANHAQMTGTITVTP